MNEGSAGDLECNLTLLLYGRLEVLFVNWIMRLLFNLRDTPLVENVPMIGDKLNVKHALEWIVVYL